MWAIWCLATVLGTAWGIVYLRDRRLLRRAMASRPLSQRTAHVGNEVAACIESMELHHRQYAVAVLDAIRQVFAVTADQMSLSDIPMRDYWPNIDSKAFWLGSGPLMALEWAFDDRVGAALGLDTAKIRESGIRGLTIGELLHARKNPEQVARL